MLKGIDRPSEPSVGIHLSPDLRVDTSKRVFSVPLHDREFRPTLVKVEKRFSGTLFVALCIKQESLQQQGVKLGSVVLSQCSQSCGFTDVSLCRVEIVQM